MQYLKNLLNALRPQSKQEWIEEYLSKSVDRYDLEARQLELTRKGIYQYDQSQTRRMGNEVQSVQTLSSCSKPQKTRKKTPLHHTSTCTYYKQKSFRSIEIHPIYFILDAYHNRRLHHVVCHDLSCPDGNCRRDINGSQQSIQ